jgi:hypothetical protein
LWRVKESKLANFAYPPEKVYSTDLEGVCLRTI